jgi:hypothetical protein
MCLPSCCLAVDVYSDLVPALGRHVTVWNLKTYYRGRSCVIVLPVHLNPVYALP